MPQKVYTSASLINQVLLLIKTENCTMRMFPLIVFVIFLSSCYSQRDFNDIPVDAPPEVREVFREFYDYAQLYKVKVNWRQLTVIYVDDLEGLNVGESQKRFCRKDRILLDKDYIQKFGLRKVLFHELGHYYLDRDHVADWGPKFTFVSPSNGRVIPLRYPPSIMTVNVPMTDLETEQPIWEKYYIPELFGVIESDYNLLISRL